MAASRTRSVVSAASRAEATTNRRVAARNMENPLKERKLCFSEFFSRIGLTGDVGQAEVAAKVRVREFRVIKPQHRENAGVNIVDVHPVFDRAQAEFVGRSDRSPALD